MSAALAEAPIVHATRAPSRPAPPNPYTRARKQLGDPTPLACTVVKTAVEAVLGGREVDTLVRWITPEIYDALASQSALARRAGKAPAHQARIKRIRVYRASEVAAEASLVVDDGVRVRAVAARFEDVCGRWKATALEIG